MVTGLLQSVSKTIQVKPSVQRHIVGLQEEELSVFPQNPAHTGKETSEATLSLWLPPAPSCVFLLVSSITKENLAFINRTSQTGLCSCAGAGMGQYQETDTPNPALQLSPTTPSVNCLSYAVAADLVRCFTSITFRTHF